MGSGDAEAMEVQLGATHLEAADTYAHVFHVSQERLQHRRTSWRQSGALC